MMAWLDTGIKVKARSLFKKLMVDSTGMSYVLTSGQPKWPSASTKAVSLQAIINI